MPSIIDIPPLTVQGQSVDCVELLDDCTVMLGSSDALRRHMHANGYIFLPGYLGRDRVIEARKVFIEKLWQADMLDPHYDPMEGVVRPEAHPGFSGGRLEALFENWKPIHDVLYGGQMMTFFRTFLGGDVRHFDFTWTRQVMPGPATPFHSDVVYMGRGTHELFTAWTPMGDNDFSVGGLLLLEGSNNHNGLAKSYWMSDVDTCCVNKPNARAWGKVWGTRGSLNAGPQLLLRSLGGKRWLTADYKMGDVVIFSVYTVHGGTDNHSNRIRLSTDSRYQRADHPVDERWIGEQPVAHGPEARRDLVC